MIFLLMLQDAWIEKLSSDDIDEREEATRQLERLGAPVIEKLERALKGERDPEVRSRLDHIIASIRKRAEFSKVFGETKRATVKRGKLKELLRQLGEQLGETFEAEGLDLEKELDLRLEKATMWEALDALAAAAGGHYEYGDKKTVLRAGARPAFPVQYSEQFRVSIVEVKRIDWRGPGKSDAVILVVLEIRHQKNMQPSTGIFDKGIAEVAAADSKGGNAKTERPDWGGTMSLNGRSFALQTDLFIRADVPGPFRVSGKTDVAFASDVKEISLPVTGDKRSTVEGAFTIRVAGFSQSEAGTNLTLEAKSGGGSAYERLVDAKVVLWAAGGKKYEGRSMGGGGGGGSWNWDFDFPAGIEKPERITFRWVREFHRVEIPFRFEGVKAP